jgi:hypothetical protein
MLNLALQCLHLNICFPKSAFTAFDYMRMFLPALRLAIKMQCL